MNFGRIGARKAYLSYGHTLNYIHVCTVKLYGILSKEILGKSYVLRHEVDNFKYSLVIS